MNGSHVGDSLLHTQCGPKAAYDAKRLGIRAGVPDLFLVLPRGEYAALWIEMKAKNGKLSIQQEICLKRLEDAGYRAVCCFGLNQAVKCINDYIR
ncbi:VRR-NUC domain-containing protein [Pectobacterium actinidiae]|uniref:VRR-NUC domain-containing protein n=1 Tax=Pectobacterium actinidiae TaxID=1507808 RepID=A0ABW8G4W5_9GAMM